MITALYAGLLGILFVALTVFVILGRNKHNLSTGTGGIAALEFRVRAHGNLAEYAPLFLVLLLLVEYQGTDAQIVHALGVVFLLGRLSHAFAMGYQEPRIKDVSKFRIAGMGLTILALVFASVLLLAN